MRRPAPVSQQRPSGRSGNVRGGHPLCDVVENAQLHRYEDKVKSAFDQIVPTLKDISAIQHEKDFEARAQRLAEDTFGFALPEEVLADAWVDQLDMRRLFAWCVFHTYRCLCDDYFLSDPLQSSKGRGFDAFLQECGFHTLDISPCADGRSAHLVRYVLRLPPNAVRRKSYAGALFDIEDSVQKWVEVELRRFREANPNPADAPTRYLKVVAYHFSSIDPDHEGCLAHGSDKQKAAAAGLERLNGFRKAIENSFCCGASIDLLLIGLDTATDSILVHVPDSQGELSLERFVDSRKLFEETIRLSVEQAKKRIEETIRLSSPGVGEGMATFVSALLENNLSQIDYVRGVHGEHYPDIGHEERFIGAGIGFEDIQLRNLMYFAYLDTVEEGAADMDVGIKIFSGLNIRHGLPVPVVVRFDFHGEVPGARERAEQRCARVTEALIDRYQDLYSRGLLHIMQAARDCDRNDPINILGCTVRSAPAGGNR